MIANIIVLIFEILYYSMFMKFARKEGKFLRYLLLFCLITIVIIFLQNQNFVTYLIFVLLALYGLKYIVKIKISLYDMLIIVIMLLLKLAIEFIFFVTLYELFNFGHFITTIVFDVAKILFLLIMNKKLNRYYKKLKILWDNNNFYIRYIFTCLTYIYVIFTLLLFIFYNFV